jgi:hypothetical protein
LASWTNVAPSLPLVAVQSLPTSVAAEALDAVNSKAITARIAVDPNRFRIPTPSLEICARAD